MTNEFALLVRKKIRKEIEMDIIKVLGAVRDISSTLNTLQEELVQLILEDHFKDDELPEEEIKNVINHINYVKKEVHNEINGYLTSLQNSSIERLEQEVNESGIGENNVH